jgi:hypothetical protein
MRLRAVLPLAVFLALAACDSKGPPKIASAQAANPAPAAPATPAPADAAPAAAASACPSQPTAPVCPPTAKIKAPGKPVTIAKGHKVRNLAKAPGHAEHRRYARVERPTKHHVEREYARVDPNAYAPAPPSDDHVYGRVERGEESYDGRRRYAEEREAARREEIARYEAHREAMRREEWRRDAWRREEMRRREYAARRAYEERESYSVRESYAYSSSGYGDGRGGCCVSPAAGRDADGFLTWPGKR